MDRKLSGRPCGESSQPPGRQDRWRPDGTGCHREDGNDLLTPCDPLGDTNESLQVDHTRRETRLRRVGRRRHGVTRDTCTRTGTDRGRGTETRGVLDGPRKRSVSTETTSRDNDEELRRSRRRPVLLDRWGSVRDPTREVVDERFVLLRCFPTSVFEEKCYIFGLGSLQPIERV